jgi:hypothetical protein
LERDNELPGLPGKCIGIGAGAGEWIQRQISKIRHVIRTQIRTVCWNRYVYNASEPRSKSHLKRRPTYTATPPTPSSWSSPSSLLPSPAVSACCPNNQQRHNEHLATALALRPCGGNNDKCACYKRPKNDDPAWTEHDRPARTCPKSAAWAGALHLSHRRLDAKVESLHEEGRVQQGENS